MELVGQIGSLTDAVALRGGYACIGVELHLVISDTSRNVETKRRKLLPVHSGASVLIAANLLMMVISAPTKENRVIFP